MLNLVFCTIRKDHYLDHVVPNLKALKSEMRRKTGFFARLRDQSIHQRWMTKLLAWIDQTETSVVSACIDKVALSRRYAHPFTSMISPFAFASNVTAKWSFDRNSHRRPMQIIQTNLIAHKVFQQTGCQRLTRSRLSSYFNGYT